jgi:hypothetical protein
MEPSIDINSYANPQQNNNLMNQLINFKANRWGPAVQQGNQGLNQGISNFNNNNVMARMFGFGGGQGSGSGAGGVAQLGGMMGGGSGAGGAAAGGGGAAGAAGGAWSYLGML